MNFYGINRVTGIEFKKSITYEVFICFYGLYFGSVHKNLTKDFFFLTSLNYRWNRKIPFPTSIFVLNKELSLYLW